MFLILLTASVGPTLAQQPATAPVVAEATDLEQLLETLTNEQRREAFTRDLARLVEAQRQLSVPEKALGTRALELVAHRMESIGRQVAEGSPTFHIT